MQLDLLLALAQLLASQGAVPEPPPLHLVVLHTNDVHGQVAPLPATWTQDPDDTAGGLARLAARVAAERAEVTASGGHVLVLDAGDWFQGTPEGRVGEGVPFVELLLAGCHYDAMAVGNHEFDLGLESFQRLLSHTKVPAVCANVYARDDSGAASERASFAPPYRIVKRGELDIAIVGFVADETPYITHPDARATFEFRNPVEEFARVVDALPEEVDLVIPLTHDGVDSDRELALAHPELALIVGGHSHSVLRSGMRQGETLIVQAGSKARSLGRVDLWLDPQTFEVERSSARLLELFEEPSADGIASELSERIDALRTRADGRMDEVVGELVDAGPRYSPFRSMPLGCWIADAMRRSTAADVGIHNRGGVRKLLDVGPITRRDLFEVMPFDNTVVAFELSGVELRACLEGALAGRDSTSIEVSGMTIALELDRKGLATVAGVSVAGEPIDPERTYRLATNSYLARGGDRVFELERELEIDDTGELIRDCLERELTAAGELALPSDDRFARTNP